jgi:hypothetical protein
MLQLDQRFSKFFSHGMARLYHVAKTKLQELNNPRW